jgi:hypothetical protein
MKNISTSIENGKNKQMSYYYKYNFVSPEPVFSIIKEELKSYFDTGAVDDLLFPTYTDKCLRKLGRSSYEIQETYLDVEDFQARLPDNFYAVREAWMCTSVDARPYQSANSFYSQAASETTIQVSPVISGGTPCTNEGCTDPGCDGHSCLPLLIQAVYKTNNAINRSVQRQYLLKPGNISVKAHCSLDCANLGSSSADSFDIRDNKFVTNFRNGVVHLVFYAYEYDNAGNQMIPDNYRIREFIEAFIKYKVFETLTNQINDETFNQIQQKMVNYKQLADEAFIMADIEIKKQDVYTKQNRIVQDLNRFNKYELPNRTNRYGWRRNG